MMMGHSFLGNTVVIDDRVSCPRGLTSHFSFPWPDGASSNNAGLHLILNFRHCPFPFVSPFVIGSGHSGSGCLGSSEA